jgi:type IV pilus assembly protein PilC
MKKTKKTSPEKQNNSLSYKIKKNSIGIKNIISRKKVTTNDILMFSQLFSSCIQTGFSVKDSLVLLSKQVPNRELRRRILIIISDLKNGSSLSDAFSRHTDVFPIFYPPLIRTGESSGNLGKVLDHLEKYLDRMQSLKKEVTEVLTYPAIVSSMGIGLLTLILIYVSPTFKQAFSVLKIKTPLPTQILFFLSDILLNNYYLIIFIFLSILIAFSAFSKTLKGKTIIHKTVLKIPFIGKVVRDTNLLRFIQAFSVLINNKVPILEALKVLEYSMAGNLYLQRIVTNMRKDVGRGLSISGALKADTMIPKLISFSIATSEKSGDLGNTLERLSLFINKDIDYSLKKISSRLDPLLTFVLGIFVLFIALSIYLPMFDLIGNVSA